MKIIADENMPNARALFSHLGVVELVGGRTLSHDHVKDADVLLVRSVTKVTKALLQGSSVSFVGSATIGVDHIDLSYLQEANIGFSSAPGCNADAVADYVFSGLSHLYMTKGLRWLNKSVGIIGFGNVGSTVYERFHQLGCDVCVYDPMKQTTIKKNDKSVNFVSLEDVLQCDVITLHAPLTRTGPFPTQGMIGAQELSFLSPGAAIISAGRGGVIDEDALIARHRQLNGELHLIIDVWQGEPAINQALVSIVDIATPHIAGYSKQGREKGTWMVYEALSRHLGVSASLTPKNKLISPGWLVSMKVVANGCLEEKLARAIQAIYDVARDDVRLRFKYRENKEKNIFDWLRKHYVERDEFNTSCVGIGGANDVDVSSADMRRIFSATGFRLNEQELR
ncbi:4-phosphoerythronate dehydrogenase [Marinomonas sp. IMCC 4694]|uniref:4-phosphoerythronate dehydrogenase n=1 Tax=Marinomonas sp. IMCC 4694 TaxID=2605432 RepID=UPI0011E738AC|nr:4-phosphoerythronate dehydrogenase [Marinomonas sp. IMCC 4694]TYL47899.1 4-phosphoerythronate dehydrogenase [Marinomonas sp. IMCC 4694]